MFIIQIIVISLLLVLVQDKLLDVSDFLSELHILEVDNSMNNFIIFVLIHRIPLILENIDNLQVLILVVFHLINDLSLLRFVPCILQVIIFDLLFKVTKNIRVIIFLLDKLFLI